MNYIFKSDLFLELDAQEDQDQDQDESTSFIDKKKALQKHFLYEKLRELQYRIEDFSIISKFKDKKNLFEFTNILRNVLLFFDTFTYDDAIKITNHLLEEFRRLN